MMNRRQFVINSGLAVAAVPFIGSMEGCSATAIQDLIDKFLEGVQGFLASDPAFPDAASINNWASLIESDLTAADFSTVQASIKTLGTDIVDAIDQFDAPVLSKGLGLALVSVWDVVSAMFLKAPATTPSNTAGLASGPVPVHVYRGTTAYVSLSETFKSKGAHGMTTSSKIGAVHSEFVKQYNAAAAKAGVAGIQ